MNIKQTLIKLEQQLRQADIDHANLDAEILVAHVLAKPREFLFSYPELALNGRQTKRLANLVRARIKGQPLAYLVGSKAFYKHEFMVTKQVLIPRPETELCVEAIVKQVSASSAKTLIIDVGTGSGCIILSLADELKHNTNCQFSASDNSYAALRVAKTNAKLLKLSDLISWHKASLLQYWLKRGNFKKLFAYERVIIVANLPYLAKTTWRQGLTARQMMELKYEPRTALFAGPDGFDWYRQLATELGALKNLAPEQQFELYAEINPNQSELFKHCFKYLKHLIIKKDLRHQPRLIIAK